MLFKKTSVSEVSRTASTKTLILKRYLHFPGATTTTTTTTHCTQSLLLLPGERFGYWEIKNLVPVPATAKCFQFFWPPLLHIISWKICNNKQDNSYR